MINMLKDLSVISANKFKNDQILKNGNINKCTKSDLNKKYMYMI